MKVHRLVAITLVALAGVAVPASAGAPEPTVELVTGGGGKPILVGASVAPSTGYVTEEYFLEGTATSYDAVGKLARNGRWRVKPADTAPFVTRFVVYRPASQDEFNGTVFVEWLNVTAGFDTAATWTASHTQIIRSGAAWVGLSAQAAGIQGGDESATAAIPSGGLKVSDAERYATLEHPGDEYSYDIYSQAGVVARNEGDPQPLDDLSVERVIAMGESQSAFRMVTYINAVHAREHAFDGYLVYSRGGSAASLGASEGAGSRDPDMPETATIRTDIDVPVLMFQTETDLTRLGYLAARQRDTKRIRLWEVAGTSHADAYTAPLGFGDADDGTVEAQLLDVRAITGGPLGCTAPINAGPMFAVFNAAVFQIERWVRDGTAPPRAPRLAITGGEIARDEHGNAEGGIRTPLVDAPIATVTGEPGAGENLCFLFGRTLPFDDAKLAALYPTHDDYVEAFNASADAAVEAGFWMEVDAEQFKAAAADLAVP